MGCVLSINEEGPRHKIDCTDHEGWVQLSGIEGFEPVGDAEAANGRTVRVQPAYHHYTEKTKDGQEKKRKRFLSHTLFLDGVDTTLYTPYNGGGTITQKKQPFAVTSSPISEKLS